MQTDNLKKYLLPVTIALLLGALLGRLLSTPVGESGDTGNESAATDSDAPLYWVAPMDPNFKRDQPGKSPMGMDLVPVYADDLPDDSPGTIRISPDIAHNIGVVTSQVKTGELSVPISTVGYVGYNQDKLVHVHPRVSGWIEKLYVKAAGNRVTKGQALYDLYSPQLVSAQEEYLIAKRRNNRTLTSAARARLKSLQLPDSLIESLDKAGQVQQTVTFVAEQDGVVDNLAIREGFFVEPGTTMMSIGALDEVWVEAEVFERQANLITTDMPVSMTVNSVPGKQWIGKVDYIYPTLDAKSRTLRLRLRFDNPLNQLKPNMFANVTLHGILSEQTRLIPSQAVIRTGQQERVVVALGDGKYKSVAIHTGAKTDKYTEVLSGLYPDDTIVVSAQFMLDSESSVSSDFLRFNHDVSDQAQRAQVTGRVNHISLADGIINISRGPIEKWGRGPATLDFVVSPQLNIATLRVGSQIDFTFEIHNGDFIIIDYLTTSRETSQ